MFCDCHQDSAGQQSCVHVVQERNKLHELGVEGPATPGKPHRQQQAPGMQGICDTMYLVHSWFNMKMWWEGGGKNWK